MDKFTTATLRGLSGKEIAAILEKWGEPVLTLVIDALNEGFSLNFILEVLDKLGTAYLTDAVAKRKATYKEKLGVPFFGAGVGGPPPKFRSPPLTNNSKWKNDGPMVYGADVQPLTGQQSLGDEIANLLLPLLVELLKSQGPQIAQVFIDALVQLLENEEQKPAILTKLRAVLDKM